MLEPAGRRLVVSTGSSILILGNTPNKLLESFFSFIINYYIPYSTCRVSTEVVETLYTKPRPAVVMSDQKRRDDLLTAVALTEFSVHYEDVGPELSQRAWQLAADRHVEYGVSPRDVDEALEIGGK